MTTYRNLNALIAAIDAETAKILSTEPAEIVALWTGNLKIGTNNQYFTTWDFANGMIRDQSMYMWYHFVDICESGDFTLDQCCKLVKKFDTPYSNYLRYSGFPTMGTFAVELHRLMPTATNAKDAGKVVRSFLTYLNRLAAWSFHAFPWGLGKDLTYTPDAGVVANLQDLSRRVTIQPGLRVKLTWDALNISVVARLAANENEKLVVEFMKACPFTVIQDHAVVSGESMYTWVPLISTAPVQVKERQCDAPVGRIHYSQGTGNKMIIQYGEVTEDIETPVLGEVDAQYAPQLKEAGQAVLENTFAAEKRNILIKVEILPLGA